MNPDEIVAEALELIKSRIVELSPKESDEFFKTIGLPDDNQLVLQLFKEFCKKIGKQFNYFYLVVINANPTVLPDYNIGYIFAPQDFDMANLLCNIFLNEKDGCQYILNYLHEHYVEEEVSWEIELEFIETTLKEMQEILDEMITHNDFSEIESFLNPWNQLPGDIRRRYMGGGLSEYLPYVYIIPLIFPLYEKEEDYTF
jgi:hypothetical protein